MYIFLCSPLAPRVFRNPPSPLSSFLPSNAFQLIKSPCTYFYCSGREIALQPLSLALRISSHSADASHLSAQLCVNENRASFPDHVTSCSLAVKERGVLIYLLKIQTWIFTRFHTQKFARNLQFDENLAREAAWGQRARPMTRTETANQLRRDGSCAICQKNDCNGRMAAHRKPN